jgi:hypothetical protein
VKGGEMTQILYAHMNKRKKERKLGSSGIILMAANIFPQNIL